MPVTLFMFEVRSIYKGKREFSYNFCTRSDQFIKDFSCKFEGNLNFLVNFFLVGFIFKCVYYMKLKMISIFWWTFLFYPPFLVNFFLVRSFFDAPFRTVSLRGPVLYPYNEGVSPSCDGWTGGTVSKKAL